MTPSQLVLVFLAGSCSAMCGVAQVDPASRPSESRPSESRPELSSPADPPGEVPAVAESPAVRELLAEWSESLREVRSLRVEFEQIKHLRILRKPRRSSGVTLLKGRRLAMQIFGADGERETELLVDAGEVRIHYPRLQKLEVYPADETAEAEPPFPLILEDVEALPRNHHLQVERDGPARWLVMTPRDPQSKVAEVRIRFEAGQMTAVEQRNRRGDRVELRIHKFEVNAEIDDEALRLEVPKDTKVVRFGGTSGERAESPAEPAPRRSR